MPKFCSIPQPLLASVAMPLILLVSACNDQSTAAGVAAAGPAEPEPSAARASGAAPAPAAEPAQLSESESLEIASAAGACASGEADSFVASFVRSAEVRRRYSAATIQYSVRQTRPDYRVLTQERFAAADYGNFPLTMMDYYFKTTAQASRTGEDEYVMLETNVSQSNQLSVEWTRVRFDGETEGGDDLGNATLLNGRPYVEGGSDIDGQLLFEPTDDCWQLVADIRIHNGSN